MVSWHLVQCQGPRCAPSSTCESRDDVFVWARPDAVQRHRPPNRSGTEGCDRADAATSSPVRSPMVVLPRRCKDRVQPESVQACRTAGRAKSSAAPCGSGATQMSSQSCAYPLSDIYQCAAEGATVAVSNPGERRVVGRVVVVLVQGSGPRDSRVGSVTVEVLGPVYWVEDAAVSPKRCWWTSSVR